MIHPTIHNLLLIFVLLGSDKEVRSFFTSFDFHELVEFQYFTFWAARVVFCSLVKDGLRVNEFHDVD